jgi:hypothetical protein
MRIRILPMEYAAWFRHATLYWDQNAVPCKVDFSVTES